MEEQINVVYMGGGCQMSDQHRRLSRVALLYYFAIISQYQFILTARTVLNNSEQDEAHRKRTATARFAAQKI